MLKLESRHVRLARRAEIWDAGLTSPVMRAHAWLDLLFFDHGFLRLCYRNLHFVTTGLWRSAQPTPGDLKSLKKKGLKSVICVRVGERSVRGPLKRRPANACN